MANLKEKLDQLSISINRLSEPSDQEEKYIIYPDEIPWWEITDKKERAQARRRQRDRVRLKSDKDYYKRYREHIRKWEENNKEYKREKDKKWRQENQERQKENVERWKRENQEYVKEQNRRWYEQNQEYVNKRNRKWIEDNRKKYTEIKRKYNQSPEGKAASARGYIKRHERATNPNLYAQRVFQLHSQKESCILCSATYRPSHQVDHITALCNGGIDDWDNYQTLCITCHGRKTVGDQKKYRSDLKLMKA